MKTFMNEDFLLNSQPARKLYHEYAEGMPIFDYHCHLSPKDMAENRKFDNLTQAWLEGDHYKWRAMRTNGISEDFVSGSAPDGEKFAKWAQTVPKTLRNPLYHWTHLELKRYFGVDDLLNDKSAEAIYRHCSDLLKQDDYSVNALLTKQKVSIVCTTDDPADSLEFHASMKDRSSGPRVLPAFRPDKALAIDKPGYDQYLRSLEIASGTAITSYDDLLNALDQRHQFFHLSGCRIADNGLNYLPSEPNKGLDPSTVFEKFLAGTAPSPEEAEGFQFYLLLELARMNHKRDWAQQFHLGAFRNTNSRSFSTYGPDTGYDSIGDFPQGIAMKAFLDRLASKDQLTRTILYNLNPADNAMFATMIGNFQDGVTPGKMQFGSGWWFLDQKFGIIDQLNNLSSMGLLSRFVGMLTDSRSFLSFPRHEYFRRILCDVLGAEIEQGELPSDYALIGGMVKDICYNNALSYFGDLK